MGLIKCSECGKKISDKAQFCPHCGLVTKKKNIIIESFKFFEIIGVLMVICFLLYAGYTIIANLKKEQYRKSYVGIWQLQTEEKSINYKVEYYNYGSGQADTQTYTIILDEELNITDENVYDGDMLEHCNISLNETLTKRCDNLPPKVRFQSKSKQIAINFSQTNGNSIKICFRKKGKNTIKQEKCSEYDNGLNDQYNIVYKKVSVN